MPAKPPNSARPAANAAAAHPTVAGRWSWSLTLTLGLLLLLVVLAAVRAGFAPLVLSVYAVASVLTLLAYAEDKRRARNGSSRIPELLLHLAELHGGWPGAFVGRELFRHKTQKRSYRAVFWLIVAAHLYVAVDYLLDWRLRDLVFRSITSLFH